MVSNIQALVIDDDDEDRLLVERNLRADQSIRLLSAASLEQGIQAAQAGSVDVILLDLGLIETTGLETLVQMREQVSDIPIVVLTGMSNDDVAIQAIELGAQDYIEKAHLNDRWISRCLRYAIQRHQLQQQLETQARTDGLTRLSNRQCFEQVLGERFARVKAHGDPGFAVGFIDLNEFKSVNDCFGHDVGDMVLCEFANRLSQLMRPCDTSARFGGDEFVVLLDGVQTRDELADFSRRLGEMLVEPVNVGGEEYHLAISIGYAICDDHVQDLRDILRAADSEMYRVKHESGPPSRAADGAVAAGTLAAVGFGGTHAGNHSN